jgi:hypothetical protein
MLFLLAMESLHKLFRKAQSLGVLSSLSKSCDMFRMSLYADDVALFLNPTSQDLSITIAILDIFGGASGLETNMSKIECYSIHCVDINLNFLGMVGLKISQFPYNYLGMPLHHKKPTRAMFQPVIQKIGGCLDGREIS